MVRTLFGDRMHEIVPNLFLGAMPYSDWDLAAVDISLVVTLSANTPPQAGEKSGLVEAQGDGTICYVHWPFADGEVPELAMLELLTGLVSGALNQGRRVLIHCSAGVNRSAMLAALVARKRLGITGTEAVRLVQASRTGTLRNRDFVAYLESLGPPVRPFQPNRPN